MKMPLPSPRSVQLLSETLSNQIAAGEVVERPASVVKELVENALDAGAERIVIEVQDGGRKQIRIVDDGHGMNRDDAEACILRHATSKIRSEADLHAIETLGFRGEALPSIASVSRFTLKTRMEQDSVGTEVRVTGGTKDPTVAIGCPVGTSVTVADLFFNVPARLKFMRSKTTEMTHIHNLIQTFALGNPRVHFTLRHNGRKTADFPKETSTLNRIHSVLGAATCKHLAETYLNADIEVAGFVGAPTASKAGTQKVYTFINGRQIRDKLLLRAITSAYGAHLERGRYPVAVLYLTVPTDWVDVNVHPTKHEVRFVQSGRVFECVSRALKQTLEAAKWGADEDTYGAQSQWSFERQPTPSSLPQMPPNQIPREASSPVFKKGGYESPYRPPRAGFGVEMLREEERALSNSAGDWGECFWMLSLGEDRLVIHKMRALHLALEREWTHWEKSEHPLPSQPLLFPEQFPLRADRVEEVNRLEWLNSYGLSLEAFGSSTLVLKAVPSLMAGTGLHSGIVRNWLHGDTYTPETWKSAALDGASEREWTREDQGTIRGLFQEGSLPEIGSQGRIWKRWTLREMRRLFGEVD